MKKQVAGLVLVSAMGIGAASTAVLAPAYAAAAQDTASQRFTEIRNALRGLVSDKTLTQAQADKVAATLDKELPRGGPGGHGGGPIAEAAGVLGMTPAELRTALGTDRSLAQVAADRKMSRATLVDKLVAAAEKRLAADVAAGRLTQAEADQRKAGLRARISEMVDRVGPPRGRDRGPGGPEGPEGGHGAAEQGEAAPPQGTPPQGTPQNAPSSSST